jgi:hypothetical protein
MGAAYWITVTAYLLVAMALGITAPVRGRWFATIIVAGLGVAVLYPASCVSLPRFTPAVFHCPSGESGCTTLLGARVPAFGTPSMTGPIVASFAIAGIASALAYALNGRLPRRGSRSAADPGGTAAGNRKSR